jgi:NTE family protein
MDRARVAAAFKGSFGIDDALLDAIESTIEAVTLPAGATLFRQGDPSDCVYVVVFGRLAATTEGVGSAIPIVRDVVKGEAVGELGVVTGEPRSATVAALRDSLVARMPKAQFEALLVARPHASLSLARALIGRIRRNERGARKPKVPINVCLLPISDGVDMAAFCSRFSDLRSEYMGPTKLISRLDVARAIPGVCDDEFLDPMGPVAQWLEDEEARLKGLTFVADSSDSAWTRRCVMQADEILLLARGDREPEIPRDEARLLTGDGLPRPPKQTLVLLHDADCASPTGTRLWLDRLTVSRHFHIRPTIERDMRRLARMICGRGVGVVLSGGGSRGFAHLGALNALAAAGVEPDAIGGVSIGAAMGALRAIDLRGDALVAAARHAFVDSGGPTSDYNLFPFISLLRGAKARRVVESAVLRNTESDIDIEDCWTSFFCVASNYSAFGEKRIGRGSLAKSVLASLAIPGVLPPVVIDGHLCIDGGVVNNLPVDLMEEFGVSVTIAIDVMAESARSVAFDRIPNNLTLLLDRLRPRKKRKYWVPTLLTMLFNATFLHSIGRQVQMRERADFCFRPRLTRVGFLDWKKFDSTVADGYESVARQARAPEVALRLRQVVKPHLPPGFFSAGALAARPRPEPPSPVVKIRADLAGAQ